MTTFAALCPHCGKQFALSEWPPKRGVQVRCPACAGESEASALSVSRLQLADWVEPSAPAPEAPPETASSATTSQGAVDKSAQTLPDTASLGSLSDWLKRIDESPTSTDAERPAAPPASSKTDTPAPETAKQDASEPTSVDSLASDRFASALDGPPFTTKATSSDRPTEKSADRTDDIESDFAREPKDAGAETVADLFVSAPRQSPELPSDQHETIDSAPIGMTLSDAEAAFEPLTSKPQGKSPAKLPEATPEFGYDAASPLIAEQPALSHAGSDESDDERGDEVGQQTTEEAAEDVFVRSSHAAAEPVAVGRAINQEGDEEGAAVERFDAAPTYSDGHARPNRMLRGLVYAGLAAVGLGGGLFLTNQLGLTNQWGLTDLWPEAGGDALADAPAVADSDISPPEDEGAVQATFEQSPGDPAPPAEPAELALDPATPIDAFEPTPESRWEQPAVAAIAGAPSYGLDRLEASMAGADAARSDLVERGLSEPGAAAAAAASYAKLCELAQVITFLAPDDSEPSLQMRRLAAQNIFHRTLRDDQARADVDTITKSWLAWTGRTHGGVFFAGMPSSPRRRGSVYAYDLEFGDGEQITLVSPEAIDGMRFRGAKLMGVVGCVIEQPAQRIDGYTGDAEQVVWVAHTFTIGPKMVDRLF